MGQEIKTQYKIMYKKDLEKDVAGDTSGNFAKILKIAQTKVRPSSTITEKMEEIAKDAKMLNTGGDSALLEILTGRSWSHLKSVFDYYDSMNKNNIDAAV